MGIENIPLHLRNLAVAPTENAATALWRTVRSLGATSFVVDDQGRLSGVLTEGDYPAYHPSLAGLTAGDLANPAGRTLPEGPDLYWRARRIFERHPHILALPVLGPERRLVDVVFKWQSFYEDYFREPARFHSSKLHVINRRAFPYMYYAYCLWRAAGEARLGGYKRFSVLEFGVAGGNGLIALEWHARALARIFNLEIEVYGFDSGEGLPPSDDVRDLPHIFGPGSYRMGNQELLRARLTGAELVLGDISETAPVFLSRRRPAPIGALLIDVDAYRAAAAALDLLTADFESLLPRVWMYFDDLDKFQDRSGEDLAIRDFNATHPHLPICPENMPAPGPGGSDRAYESFLYRLKLAHILNHPGYRRHPGPEAAAESSARRFQTRY